MRMKGYIPFLFRIPSETKKPTAYFARHPVFRFDEFRAAHLSEGKRSPQTTASVLKQHVAAGRLINVRRGLYARVPEGTGFVIVTAAAEGGLVDVHDRRPVVFAAGDAALWMDNGFPPEQAEQLARSLSLPPDAFEWYEVSKDVNKVGANDAHLIEPCS
jgi:putative SOS response-associated peptidase YedK